MTIILKKMNEILKKRIEEAAMDYAGLTDDSKDSYARERGARCIAFKDGVRWVLETLCELPLDEMIRELAEYAHERIGGSPGADHLASRMMKDNLAGSAWHGMNEKPDGMFVILVDFGSEDGQEEHSLDVSLGGHGKRKTLCLRP